MKSEIRTTRMTGGHSGGRLNTGRGSGKQTPQRSDVSPRAGVVAPEERHRMIAEAAYFKAERRGFQGGDCDRDWLDSEAEIDAILLRGGHR
jgi:hypothetical protein